MYELNGTEYSLEQLQGAAQKYNMDFDSYLETMKSKGLVEKTNGVAEEQGVPVTSETTAPESGGSTSVNTSSESLDRAKKISEEIMTAIVGGDMNKVEELKLEKAKLGLETTTRVTTQTDREAAAKERIESGETKELQNRIDLTTNPTYQRLRSTYDQAVETSGNMSQQAANALATLQQFEQDNLQTLDPNYSNELLYNSIYNDVDVADEGLDNIFNQYYQFYQEQGDDQGTAAEKANQHVADRRDLEPLNLQKKRQDKQIIEEGFENLQTVTQDDDLGTMSWEDDDAENIEISNEIKKEIFKNQGLEGLDRMSQDDQFILDINEKENIITNAKSNVLNRRYKDYEEGVKTLEESEALLIKQANKFEEEQRVVKQQLDALGDINETSSQEDINAYNNLVVRNNELIATYEDLKAKEEELKASNEALNNSLGKTFAELGFNAFNQTFKNNFEVTDKIRDYKDRFIKKSLETDSWWKKKGYESWDAIATFVNEGSQMIYKSTIGLGGFLGYQTTRIYRDDTEYFDANEYLLEAFSSPGKVELLAESEIGADISNKFYKPGDKSTFEQIIDSDAYNVNFRNATKMVADMLPFTLGIMYSGGAVGVAQGTNIYTKGANILKNFAPIARNSTKIKQGIRMLDATYRMTVTDNYTDGINQGLDDNSALVYANAMSIATGLSQMIMPDRNFLATPAGRGIVENFTGSLKKAATIEARKKILTQFVTNIGKELGEEEVEMAMQDLVKLSMLEGFHSEFLDAKAQREVIVGTLLLSGTLGTVGGAKNYKKTKEIVYNQYRDNAQDIIDNIDIDLELAKQLVQKVNNDKRYNEKSKQVALDNYNQVYDTKQFATEIRNAIKISPENVTQEQIDLLIQKQKLVNQKQTTDKAFHADLDSKIKGLDEAIQNSEVIQKREEVLDKTTKNVNKISGNQVISFDTTEELKQRLIEDGYSEEDADYNSRQEGFFNEKTGELYMNRAVSLSGGSSNVAAHEYLHKMIAATVNTNSKVANQVAQSLGGFLMELDPAQFTNSAFIKKLELYQTRQSEIDKIKKDNPNISEESFQKEKNRIIDMNEHRLAIEVLTLASDALATGDITVETTSTTKIKDFLRRTGQNIKGSAIKFDTSEDILNFLRDYNTSVKKGRLTKAQRALVDGKKIEGALTEVENEINNESTVGQQQSREEASAAVQEIYNEQGAAGVYDIIQAFKLITENIAKKYEKVPGYDKALLMGEIELSDRGIYGLVTDYPSYVEEQEQKREKLRTEDVLSEEEVQKAIPIAPLAGFVNKWLKSRTIEIARNVLKEEFEDDITQARGVAADEDVVTPEKERRTKGVIIGKVVGMAKRASDIIGPIYEENRSSITNLANTPMLLTELVSEISGIPVKKLEKQANLNQHLAPAQMAAAKHAQLLLQILPKQHTTKRVKVGENEDGSPIYETRPDKSTRVPQKVLDFFYNKGTRKDNLTPWTLKRGLSERDIIKFAGVVDGTRSKDENRYYQQNLLGLWRLFDRVWSNQELRIEGEKRGETPTSLEALREGNRPVVFSKSARAAEFTSVVNPSNVEIPLIRIQLLRYLLEGKIDPKTGMPKSTTGFRDMDAEYAPGLTFDEQSTNIANNFLSKYPQFTTLLKNTMTGGIKGGLFLTDAEFKKRIKIDKEFKDAVEDLLKYRYDYNFENRLTKKAVEGFADEKTSKDKDVRLEILYQFWKAVEIHLNNNSEDQWFFEALVRDTSRGQGALTRVLAPFMGYAVDKNGKPIYNKKVVEEHSMPQNNVSFAYLNAAIEGTVDELKPVIEATYMQISLLKTDDDAMRDSGLEKSMPDIYYDLIVPKIKSGELEFSPGTAAVVRLAATGTPYAPKAKGKAINLHGIFIPSLNETLGEHFGVEKAMDTKMANTLLIERLAGISIENSKASQLQAGKVTEKARSVNSYSKTSRGMSTFDFDETLIDKGENFITATKGDEIIKITSAEWPTKGPLLAEEGFMFDFKDFINVRGGIAGPLMTKFKNQIKKYGIDNVFILTARPPEAAPAIQAWLGTQGINMPIENITGLGNSAGEAKAEWMLDKYAEGYNDMYFVDDAMPNVEAVQNVFDQLDVKGKSVQARLNFSLSLNGDFNKMLERTKGIGAEKVFSRIGAQKRGRNIGKFEFFVPPSAEDFTGLLRYFVGKGNQGDADIKFFKEALVRPFARADEEMKRMRQTITDDYKALRKELPQVKKKLGKMIGDSGFTYDNAIRVYLWGKAGFDIPGLSKRDIKLLTDTVAKDADLRAFADTLGLISKAEEGYIKPGEYWNVESIASDLQNVVNKVNRKKYLAEWIENKNIIFSEDNLNKIEATYGSNFREALENILWRMENGTNRAKGMGRIESAWNNWVNNSVGAIMFFNARSAVLQTLSTVNFINFQDNNIFAAAKAFANQPQYWKDFVFLFNSDFLKQRRAGLQINVNEAEIANAVAGAANKAKAAISYLLKIGFLPTQIADSFAIASGGSTYYRNRVKKYIKEGMDQKAAEEKAMVDFMEIAEETQQSARPDRISQQQASSLGRIILAFANTPMQYNRLIKKAAGDLINKRGDWRSNISRIVYYGAIQNMIFSGLQSAIFALAFDDEDDEEVLDKKSERMLNGMIDSLLRGSGLAGAVVATIKNTILKFMKESDKEWNADYGNVIVEALNVSPPLGSKVRKLYNSTKTYKFNREVMGEMDTFDLENPVWEIIGNVVSATTNAPLDRGFRKIDNMKEMLNQDNETWQRIFVGLGWDQWGLGIDSRKEVDEAKERIKEKKKEEKKKNQQRCTKIKSDGERCKIMIMKPKKRCHYHD